MKEEFCFCHILDVEEEFCYCQILDMVKDICLDDIDQLEEDRIDVLERTKAIQAKWKEVYVKRITLEKGIEEGGLILLYDK